MFRLPSTSAMISLCLCIALIDCQYETNLSNSQGGMKTMDGTPENGSRPTIASATVTGLKSLVPGTLTIIGTNLDNCTFSLNGKPLIPRVSSQDPMLREFEVDENILKESGISGVAGITATKIPSGPVSEPKIFSYRLEEEVVMYGKSIPNGGNQLIAYARLNQMGVSTIMADYHKNKPAVISINDGSTTGTQVKIAEVTTSSTTTERICGLAVYDLDHDGFNDLIYATRVSGSKIYIFIHRGISPSTQGYFTPTPDTTLFPATINPILSDLSSTASETNPTCRLSIANVDGNGNPDIIVQGIVNGSTGVANETIVQTIYLHR